MSDFNLLCVTSRHLCPEKFLQQMEKICQKKPAGVIVREKDLSSYEYEKLALQILRLCNQYQIPCILHYFIDTAIRLGVPSIHLPLPVFREMTDVQKSYFSSIGISCHSLEEAQEAVHLGCTFISAGHIFPTDCKKDLLPRGLSFLENICQKIPVPVYAIGGITPENIPLIRQTHASGACIMSGFMQCKDLNTYCQRLGL